MLKLRHLFIMLGILSYPMGSSAEVSIGISTRHVSIGINLPAYPRLILVPGYPVYYAPDLDINFFFYDGLYWIYLDDNWYVSSWYNGPWTLVARVEVPLYILRIPVRYYRRPPVYFRGWISEEPPRWSDRWGHDWERHRPDWRNSRIRPAPLPSYQRQYPKDRYPRQEQRQRELEREKYKYQPRDPAVRKHYEQRTKQRAPEQQRGPDQQERRERDRR